MSELCGMLKGELIGKNSHVIKRLRMEDEGKGGGGDESDLRLSNMLLS